MSIENEPTVLQDEFWEGLPDRLTTMNTPKIFRYASQDLVKIGRQTMNVEEITALSRIIDIATVFGYRFAQYEAEHGLPENNEEVVEMATEFGLVYDGMQYLVNKPATETEVIK